jgi:hypothetical protein
MRPIRSRCSAVSGGFRQNPDRRRILSEQRTTQRDDPNDLPGAVGCRVNDPRIRYVLHAQNLAAVGSFNLAFQSVCKP